MNDQSDSDKPVLPPVQSQSGANYYRPVDEQASESVDNSNAQVTTEAKQTSISAEPKNASSEPANVKPEPANVSPAPATTMDMSADPSTDKLQNPVDQVAKLPKLTLASIDEPPAPPFSAELTAKNPTKPFGKADSPTIKPPESSAEIAEKMKTANKKTGSGGAFKAIMTIVLATVVVVGAWLAYNWYQSSVETTPISLNQEQNNQNNSKTSLPTNLDEDKVDVEIPDEAVALAEIPLTSYVQLGTATAETAEVSGTVCPFSGEAKPGILAFYEVDTKQLYKSDMTSENNVFTVNIPAGRYLTIFEPTQIDLPNFAYTEYVRCGLDPNECTDHSLSVYQVEAGKTYGQIRVCDPQYKQEGLPASMQFEYDAL